jgi:hypothetical protein
VEEQQQPDRPTIEKLSTTAERLAHGDLAARSNLEHKGEIGKSATIEENYPEAKKAYDKAVEAYKIAKAAWDKDKKTPKPEEPKAPPGAGNFTTCIITQSTLLKEAFKRAGVKIKPAGKERHFDSGTAGAKNAKAIGGGAWHVARASTKDNPMTEPWRKRTACRRRPKSSMRSARQPITRNISSDLGQYGRNGDLDDVRWRADRANPQAESPDRSILACRAPRYPGELTIRRRMKYRVKNPRLAMRAGFRDGSMSRN